METLPMGNYWCMQIPTLFGNNTMRTDYTHILPKSNKSKLREKVPKQRPHAKKIEEAAKCAQEHHRQSDAKKYMKKYDHATYLKYYVPLLNKFNGDLAGVKILAENEDESDSS
ncbi:hypothetical protein B0H13DRAFT_1855048 [Mycena leptocephala]|nr:hypothetical protein B0H13DRAFT_1855048 [Mycena leptocephala]